MIPANRLGPEFVAQPMAGANLVPVGDEVILVDGWMSATVLNPAAAAIWASFDGRATLGQVIDELTDLTGADHPEVSDEVIGLARRVGALGLLAGVGPPDDVDIDIRFEKIPRYEQVGATLPPFHAVDLDDVELPSSALAGTETILVNWNPHCGYCVSIAHVLAACQEGLDARGVKLVLLASGSAAANREMAHVAGLRHAEVVRPSSDGPHPLPGIGTPAAYHLDAELRLASAPAYGNVDVPALVARLAGVELDENSGATGDRPGDGVRYLLQPGGACAQGTGVEPVPHWVTTRVYRIGDFHVGLRCGTDETVGALDELFHHSAVQDPAAGHTFAVSLSGTGNLLVQGSRVFVRSGSPGRVLRALLARLHDGIVDFDPACGRIQVDATAALVGGRAVLLQPGLHVLAEKLEPLLAQRGIALADFPHPEIDLDTCEVVLPEPVIDHDPTVVTTYDDAYDAALDPRTELPAVRPGRYPLAAWAVMHPADAPVTRFTPAQAAVATLSHVQRTDDAAARIGQLGELFARMPGYGLWYHSEAGYVDALCEALEIG